MRQKNCEKHDIIWNRNRPQENKITMSVKIFFPKTKASPEVGGRRPTSIDIVVLLPAPLCPSS